MDTREWALISFTILTQMSVGSFLALGVVYFFATRKFGKEPADHLSDRALLAIGPVLALAILTSLLHLGSPLKAYLAASNFATSWLSREILLTVVFFGVGGAFALMQWKKIGTAQVRNIIAWVAAIDGLALVYSMSQVYMIDVQPFWNNFTTPITFFTTTFLLGALAIGAVFVVNYTYLQKKESVRTEAQRDLLLSSLRWIAVASVVLLGVEFVVIPLSIAYLASGNVAAAASARMMVEELAVVIILRLALAFLGAGILATFLYHNAANIQQEKVLPYLAYSAFLLVLVAEVLGRYIFYAAHVSIGV